MTATQVVFSFAAVWLDYRMADLLQDYLRYLASMGRRKYRRIKMDLGLEYTTPAAKVEEFIARLTQPPRAFK